MNYEVNNYVSKHNNYFGNTVMLSTPESWEILYNQTVDLLETQN